MAAFSFWCNNEYMTKTAKHSQLPAELLEFDLGDRLRKALRESSMTGRDLAAALGVSRNTVTSWLNGRTKPRPIDLSAISDVIGVSSAWLTSGDLSDHKPN